MALSEEQAAGKYGEAARCDLPVSSVELQLKWLSKKLPTPEYVLWTGDSVSHDLIGLTGEDVLESLQKSTDLIRKYFPNSELIVALGNHDFEVANFQSFETPNSPFLHQVAEIWSPALPPV